MAHLSYNLPCADTDRHQALPFGNSPGFANMRVWAKHFLNFKRDYQRLCFCSKRSLTLYDANQAGNLHAHVHEMLCVVEANITMCL